MPLGDRLSFHTMVQNRWTDGVKDAYERTVVRPWLAVALPHHTEAAVGYDMHGFENPDDRREHRAWQRIAWAPRPASRVTLLSHFWLEERFFEGASDVAVRGRFNVGARFDLGRDFDLVVRNEFFVNFNETSRVRATGLGENQLVVAFMKGLPGGLTFQAGYLQQYLDRPGGSDLFNHTAVTGFVWRTPAAADWL